MAKTRSAQLSKYLVPILSENWSNLDMTHSLGISCSDRPQVHSQARLTSLLAETLQYTCV